MNSSQKKQSIPSISLPTRAVPLADMRPQFSRQILRAIGYEELKKDIDQKFPLASRRLRRQAARQAQKDSWEVRDRAAVAKLIHG